MEQSIKAHTTEEQHYCCTCHVKQAPAPQVQAIPVYPYHPDESVQNMELVLQKRQEPRDDILQAMKILQRRHGISAKPKKRRFVSGAKTHWSADETEALLLAVESCSLADRMWSSKANKWDKVLQHMQEHGFSEKTAFTVQKKFQNMHWAFRNLKAWRVREKLPLFENLSPVERMARLLPRSYCPKLYARMEAFFASSGLDDGVHMVRDQDRVSRRKSTHTLCSQNDVDDDDDDDDDPTYRSRGASLPVFRDSSSGQLALGWHTTSLNKSKGKHASVQRRKQPFRHCCMRGLLLPEGMDLEKVFKKSNLHNDDDPAAECCELEEDNGNEKHHSLQIGGAKQAVGGYLEGVKSPTNLADVNDCDDCNEVIDGNATDDNEGIDVDDDGNGKLKSSKPCADGDGIKLSAEGYTKKQLKRLMCGAATLDNAMNGRKARKVQRAPCGGEEVDGQNLIDDEKVNHVILQQVGTNNKQLSDCIQAVIMSIQTVNLILDKCHK